MHTVRVKGAYFFSASHQNWEVVRDMTPNKTLDTSMLAPLSVSLSLSLSLCLSLPPPSLYLSLYPSLYLSLSLSPSFPLSLSIFPALSLALSSSLFLSLRSLQLQCVAARLTSSLGHDSTKNPGPCHYCGSQAYILIWPHMRA